LLSVPWGQGGKSVVEKRKTKGGNRKKSGQPLRQTRKLMVRQEKGCRYGGVKKEYKRRGEAQEGGQGRGGGCPLVLFW